MAISNSRDHGAKGYEDEYLIDLLTTMQGVIDGLAGKIDDLTTKLNADTGVTDTDYATNFQAKVQASLPVASAPVDSNFSVATISTAIQA